MPHQFRILYLKMPPIIQSFIIFVLLFLQTSCSDMKVEFSNLTNEDAKKESVTEPTVPTSNAEILPNFSTQESVNKHFKITAGIHTFGDQLYYESLNKKYKIYLSQQGSQISITGGSK